MAAIREELILADKFSATFSRYLTLGSQAAGATERANTAVKNYQAVLSSLDRRLITLNSQFAAMAGEQQGLLAAGRQNSAEFAALDARMEQLGGAIRTLQAQYSAVEREAEEAAAANRSLAGSFDTVRQASAGAVRAPTADAAESAIGQTAPYLARSGGAASAYAKALADVQAQLARANVDLTVQRQLLTQTSAGQTAAAGTAADLERELSGTVSRVQRLTAEERALRTALESATGGAKQADRALEQYQQSAATARAATSGLTNSVRNLLGAFAGMQAVRWLVNTSDQLTSINARLQLMTGSAEAAAAAQNEIYQAAMRSRGAYANMAMADFVSQLGTTAGNAFRDTNELIAFAEQIQKQLAISGASGASAQAALVQLTQGLSSGTLRGEELNSVLEQTPMIAQTIANYMGVTTGQMRELASQGAVTAEVVKNAMFAAADETNAKFEEMPMTWAQVWTAFQNTAVMAMQPVLDVINAAANNLDILIPIVATAGAAFAVFMLAANWVNICTAATNGLAAAQRLFGLASAQAWAIPLIIIVAVVGAVYLLVAAYNRVTGATVSATGIIAGAFFTMGALIANHTIVPLQRAFAAFVNFIGNVFNDPVTAIKVLFYDMAMTVLGYIRSVVGGIEDLVNKIPGVQVSLTSGIDRLYNQMTANREAAIAAGSYQEFVKPMEYFDLGEAFQSGYNWGNNFLNFDGMGTSAASYNEIPTYDQMTELTDAAKSIEKSVNMSEEDLKMLIDNAERRYVSNVNLTSQTPVINITGANTGDTAADRKALADAIQTVLVEQLASTSVRATAVPT